jgi:murein DD-endopeptidase MepM/ murein hydrolase activator NlpD
MRHSKLVYISRDHTTIKEYTISRLKILLYSLLFTIILVSGGKFGIDFLVEFSRDSDIMELEERNAFLNTQIGEMQDQIKLINEQVTNIESKDDELRMVMGLKEISSDIRDVGIGGTDYSFNFPEELLNPEESEKISAVLEYIDKLQREVKLESELFLQLHKTYYAKEDSIKHMPTINPVLEGRITSFYGRRIHPVYHRPDNHEGIDISAKLGTPVYAAADGVVKQARRAIGYGNLIVIDHKMGFVTKYGHLDKMLVREGQPVKRGDRIGLVGKTGTATAPHLHYEILFNNKHFNPIDFYWDDYETNKLAIKE